MMKKIGVLLLIATCLTYCMEQQEEASIIHAAREGSVKDIKQIIINNKNINATDEYGNNAIQVALLHKRPEKVLQILTPITDFMHHNNKEQAPLDILHEQIEKDKIYVDKVLDILLPALHSQLPEEAQKLLLAMALIAKDAPEKPGFAKVNQDLACSLAQLPNDILKAMAYDKVKKEADINEKTTYNNDQTDQCLESKVEEENYYPIRSQISSCAYCIKTINLKKCGGCKQMHYCSTECQKKHWPLHRNECKKYNNNG